MVEDEISHSNTLLSSNPLENSLSFESQIVSSSPSLRGTTSHTCQHRQSEWPILEYTKDRFLCGAARRNPQVLATGPNGTRTFPERPI